MRRFPILLAPLALLLALNLVACGNKGPLVRPSDIEDVEDVADDDVGAVEEEAGEEPADTSWDAADDAAGDSDADDDTEMDDDPAEVPQPPADPGNG